VGGRPTAEGHDLIAVVELLGAVRPLSQRRRENILESRRPLGLRIARADDEERDAICVVRSFEVLQDFRGSVRRRRLGLDVEHHVVVWVRRGGVGLLAPVLFENINTEPTLGERRLSIHEYSIVAHSSCRSSSPRFGLHLRFPVVGEPRHNLAVL